MTITWAHGRWGRSSQNDDAWQYTSAGTTWQWQQQTGSQQGPLPIRVTRLSVFDTLMKAVVVEAAGRTDAATRSGAAKAVEWAQRYGETK